MPRGIGGFKHASKITHEFTKYKDIYLTQTKGRSRRRHPALCTVGGGAPHVSDPGFSRRSWATIYRRSPPKLLSPNGDQPPLSGRQRTSITGSTGGPRWRTTVTGGRRMRTAAGGRRWKRAERGILWRDGLQLEGSSTSASGDASSDKGAAAALLTAAALLWTTATLPLRLQSFSRLWSRFLRGRCQCFHASCWGFRFRP